MSVDLLIWLALAAPLGVSVLAAVVSADPTPTLDSFLLARRDMSRGHYIATLTASNAALANILFLYVYWGYTYGIWAWLWASVFWGLGFLVFSRLMSSTRLAELLDPQKRTEFSYNEIMGTEYNSPSVRKACAVVSGLAFLFLLTLELNVGAKIFTGMSPQSTLSNPYVLALLMGSVIAMYTALGGMSAVVKTDAWQLPFVLVASLCLLVLGQRIAPSGSPGLLGLVGDSALANPIFELSWRYLPFVLGSVFSWSFWFLCTMDMWQRTLVVRIARPQVGVKAILPSFLLLSFISFSGVVTGIFVKAYCAFTTPPKYPLVDFLRFAYAAATSDAAAAILLCIVVAGFVAALLSTVDTYLMIVAHCFVADLGKDTVTSLAADEFGMSRPALRRLRRCIAATPFLSTILFFSLERGAQQDTFTLYMIAGSIPFAVLPITLVPLFPRWAANRHEVSADLARYAYIALAVGMFANFMLTRHALATYDARAFGLLYFLPLAVSTVAALPLLRLRR